MLLVDRQASKVFSLIVVDFHFQGGRVMCKFFAGQPMHLLLQEHLDDLVNFLFQFSASLYQHESNCKFGCIPLHNPGSGHNVGLAHDYLVSTLIAYPAELSIWYLSTAGMSAATNFIQQVRRTADIQQHTCISSLHSLCSLHFHAVQVVLPPDHATGKYIPAVHVQGILFWQQTPPLGHSAQIS